MNAPATVIEIAATCRPWQSESPVPVSPSQPGTERAAGKWPQRSFLELGAPAFEEIDAALLIAALRSREQHARNPVALRAAMQAPGPGWREGYPLEAKRSLLTAHLNRLDNALAHVGVCLNPILAGTVTSGRWNSVAQRWET